MILSEFKIEFQDSIPEEKQKEMSEYLKKFSALTKAIKIEITGDINMTLHEYIDICHLPQEKLAESTIVEFSAFVNEEFKKGQKEVVLTLSDDENEFKTNQTDTPSLVKRLF